MYFHSQTRPSSVQCDVCHTECQIPMWRRQEVPKFHSLLCLRHFQSVQVTVCKASVTSDHLVLSLSVCLSVCYFSVTFSCSVKRSTSLFFRSQHMFNTIRSNQTYSPQSHCLATVSCIPQSLFDVTTTSHTTLVSGHTVGLYISKYCHHKYTFL